MLKKISNFKELSNEELKKVNGGFDPCFATWNALADGAEGGYLDDPVTMETLVNQYISECISQAQ
ncbi:class IIb bacteriocin, lactobin A/cerein 7B family [Tenacibaculum sp. MAR_2009_124]|uniref:bacteriocin class II family protein n=1 Tax=Tenacibaculum sp. MAR_2009_124 TaxID=1250059 RepID=UPI0008969778|nr:bacteriocin class II family protein [Tenacibaculum sp. MAR_2009_124]SEC26893.1 class IIb bacteriocin, lactobin A/cerein 7B family [Tenacibaculum sp. MAR_2009_124]